MPTTEIKPMTGGPCIIEGEFTVTDAEGKNLAEGKSKVAVCRCGASGNQPFCDGSHGKIGFDK